MLTLPHFLLIFDELDPVDAFITETFGIECPLHSSAITLCLASVCWHKERLADISPGYATMIPSLPQPATGIRSLYIRGTGVPPDISLHCVIRDLKEQQDSTLEFLRTYRDETRTWRERLLGQVRDTIEKHWELNGTVTPHHMKEVIGASLENQLDILMSGVNKLLDDRLPARVVQTPTAPSVPTPSAGQFAFRPGVPGFSSLPVGFCLSPKWTLHQICYFYFRPQDYKGEPVPALREMDAGDFRFHPKRKEQTSILRDIKMVMSHVLNQLSSDCSTFSSFSSHWSFKCVCLLFRPRASASRSSFCFLGSSLAKAEPSPSPLPQSLVKAKRLTSHFTLTTLLSPFHTPHGQPLFASWIRVQSESLFLRRLLLFHAAAPSHLCNTSRSLPRATFGLGLLDSYLSRRL